MNEKISDESEVPICSKVTSPSPMDSATRNSTNERCGNNFDRTLDYALVGAATATAAMAANAHPRGQALKTIAVGAAGLIGIRMVADPDGQRTTLTQAEGVMQCLIRVFDAVGQAKANAPSAQQLVGRVSFNEARSRSAGRVRGVAFNVSPAPRLPMRSWEQA